MNEHFLNLFLCNLFNYRYYKRKKSVYWDTLQEYYRWMKVNCGFFIQTLLFNINDHENQIQGQDHDKFVGKTSSE